jgi:nicotinate dehydrogenase subunit B
LFPPPGIRIIAPNQGGVQIRQAAATARRALMQQAAQPLGVPAGELVTDDGTVRSGMGGKSVTYGELIGGKTFAAAPLALARPRRQNAPES